MKSFTQLTESAVSAIPNCMVAGNLNNGIMNHYIPIENIVINVRNIFAPWFGLVVEPGEDGRTLKVYNSTFCSPEAVETCLNFKPDGRTSLREYVAMQGLPLYKTVSCGGNLVVYFYSTDIAGQQDPSTFNTSPCRVEDDIPTESLDEEITSTLNIAHDNVYISFNEDDETEMRDIINKTFYDIAGEAGENGSDKKMEAAIGQNVAMPDGYYWANVKDEDGHKSIALRKKVSKRLSFNRTKKYTVSIINIYNNGKDAIWVNGFDRKDIMYPEDVALIEGILSFIGAKPTSDPCVYTFEKPVLQESNVGCELNTLYTVYDGDGQPLQSFTLEADAKVAAEKFAKDNKVKCVVKKEKI